MLLHIKFAGRVYEIDGRVIKAVPADRRDGRWWKRRAQPDVEV